MSPARARAPDAPIIASMSTVDADELHRLSTDEYHRLIEAGAFEDFPRIELIDGLLLRMSPRTREHENAVAWLAQWLMFGVDQERFEVRIAGSLTLEGSEPEPDLAVIPRAATRPYHPATAALVVEVAVSSLKRDLQRKPALYARAAVGEYWVVDVEGRRIIVHRAPRGGSYTAVLDVRAGARIAPAPAGLPELDVDELLRAANV